MKIVRHKTSMIVLYLLDDSADISINTQRMFGDVIAYDIKSATHEIVENVTRPAFFHGGVFVYDTAWVVTKPELIPKEFDDLAQELLITIDLRSDLEQNKSMMIEGIPVRNHKDDIAEIHGTDIKDPSSRAWKKGLGDYVTITNIQMKKIREAVHDRRQDSRDRAKILSDQVNAAVDFAGLSVIDIYSDWPIIGTTS